MFQSNEEIFRVFVDWFENVAPKNLIQNDHNGRVLSEYVVSRGLVSVGTLNAAVEALGNQLQYTLAPRQKTQEEIAADFQAREFARIQREAAENAKPFDHGKKIQESVAAKEEAKRQQAAQSQIDFIIHNYSVNAGPGRIDHGKSDSGRAILRNIKIQRGGKYDAPLTLKVLQQAHMFDTPSEIIRAAEKAKNALVDAANAMPDKGPIR
jgi:hypothetical protein